jgi:hypothetical protein
VLAPGIGILSDAVAQHTAAPAFATCQLETVQAVTAAVRSIHALGGSRRWVPS